MIQLDLIVQNQLLACNTMKLKHNLMGHDGGYGIAAQHGSVLM